MVSMDIIRVVFNLWRDKVLHRKYDDWCEQVDEELAEMEYAANENMDSVYWCWNCKHHDCIH